MTRRAVIAGAGIGGLSAAIAPHRAGWDVEVRERWASPWDEGAGISLWPNALRALDASATTSAPSGTPTPPAASATATGTGSSAPTTPRWRDATATVVAGLPGRGPTALRDGLGRRLLPTAMTVRGLDGVLGWRPPAPGEPGQP